MKKIDFKKLKIKYILKIKNLKTYLKLKKELLIYHENVWKIRDNLPIWLGKSIRISVIGLIILMILRLLRYKVNYLNWVSCICLYFLILNIPKFIRECRKR